MKYTKMTVITRREKFEALQNALLELGIGGMTVTMVEGNGQQLGNINYADFADKTNMKVMLIPKVMVEAIYTGMDNEKIIEKVCESLRTHVMGDGKIFFEEIEGEIIKVRTQEKNEQAL